MEFAKNNKIVSQKFNQFIPYFVTLCYPEAGHTHVTSLDLGTNQHLWGYLSGLVEVFL